MARPGPTKTVVHMGSAMQAEIFHICNVEPENRFGLFTGWRHVAKPVERMGDDGAPERQQDPTVVTHVMCGFRFVNQPGRGIGNRKLELRDAMQKWDKTLKEQGVESGLKAVVGWFRFRANTWPTPSCREVRTFVVLFVFVEC